MALTHKQQLFVGEYLSVWNASEAARRAGYTGRANTIGSRLLLNVVIAEEIKRRIAERAMSADEVLDRLAEHARGDIGEWLTDDGTTDIAAMKRAKKTRLLRKVKHTYRSGETEAGGTWQETRVEVELHDAQAALVHLGKHHGLFKDIMETKSELGIDEETRELLSRVSGLASRIRADEDADGTGADQSGESAA